ncbi:hypothetical protein PoB_002632000 [Plakobranchus ocellatus]|uniref:HP domain-containing protein n=1 Tax=Plakobranchus ocellatus TaxID=259542 RepID=A0AAV3ZVC9_9GAST|nr:hypothetical protein PoB_002632000 [Plakobranchus ocellatus]
MKTRFGSMGMRTADEKLRSIGKAQQPATSVQTQNFTFVRHHNQPQQQQQQQQSQFYHQQQQQYQHQNQQCQVLQNRSENPQQQPLRRLSEQEIIQEQVDQELKRKHRQNQWQQQQQQQQENSNEHGKAFLSTSAAAAERGGVEQKEQIKNEEAFMAERAIASRHARRDRNAPDSLDKGEVKRRSRSEGPVKGRVRHSMDERGGRAEKKQTFDGGGRMRPFCIDNDDSESSGDVSDPGRPYYRGGRGVPRADSESDSDRQRWTKNPLVVRRVKRPDKHTRNRLSGGAGLTTGGAAENGVSTGGFYGNEDAAASSGGGGGGTGSGSGGRSKYQRLEEMRRRRINMAATSDEEGAATPAVRISRLRQRALQSGLGGTGGGQAARPTSNITPSNSFKSFNSNMAGGIGGISGGGNIDKSPMPLKNFVPYQREISNTSTSSSSQFQPWGGGSQTRQDPHNSNQNKGSLVYAPLNPGGLQPSSLHAVPQHPQSVSKSPAIRPKPSNPHFGSSPKLGQASFFTVPDPNQSQANRSLYSSSPDMASQRFIAQSRIPSADSVMNPVLQDRTNKSVTYLSERLSSVQNPSVMARSSLGGSKQIQSNVQSEPSQTASALAPSQFNKGVEMRFKAASSKTSNQERPKSQSKIPMKGIVQKLGISEDYEDSLDELIESNIQYLDNEINKASKPSKRASIAGTNVSKSSSLSDPQKSSLGITLTSVARDQFQGLHQYRRDQKHEQQQQQQQKPLNYQQPTQQPAIQVQTNTSIQLHVSLPGELKDSGPPRIQIAPPVDYPFKPYPMQAETLSRTSATKLDHMQPDVVPRKYSYDSRALHMTRPTSEYQYVEDRDDLSKSDSQLNTHIVHQPHGSNLDARMVMSSGGGISNNRQLQYVNPVYHPRGCVSDINLNTEPSKNTPAVNPSNKNDLLQVLQVDKGMFSDVEYDIEVSERVKKWETFMKDRDAVGEKKTAVGSLNLATIQENTEASSEPLMLPSAIRRSVLLSKSPVSQSTASNNSITAFSSSIVSDSPIAPFSYSTTEVAPYTPPARHRPFSSDTSIDKLGDTKLLSVNTSSTQRFFQSIQDPMSGGHRLGPFVSQNLGIHGAQSTNSLFQQQGPIKIRTSYSGDNGKGLMSAHELRNQMLSHKQPLLSLTGSGPLQALHQPSQAAAPPLQITSISSASTPPPQLGGSSSTNTPVVVRRRKTSRDGGADPRDVNKRGSKYQEELDEISNMRTDSVGNLRKRFDPDSAAMTSEDDQRSVVSTASAKLSRPGKLSAPTSSRASVQRSGGETSSTDLATMIPGYEKKIRDSDVWSPNLESTQGVPVSIERVTARTLQTIPFSEDPFWKELEEMTSFDPSSMAGHLSLGNSQNGGPTPTEPFAPAKSHHHLEIGALSNPHSSTLPTASSLTHSRNNAMSSKDRLQRSKSLYTPNFTPLSIDTEKASSNAVDALDEVLDDINRSSMERKQLSPKKKLETSINASSAITSAFKAPSFLKPKQGVPQTTYKFEDGQFKSMNTAAAQPSKIFEPGNLIEMRAEQTSLPQKQPLQFYQIQRQQQQQKQHYQLQPLSEDNKANRQSQAFSSVNNYQLDPNLLKEKLLNTGLVVETDTEDNVHSDTTSYRRNFPEFAQPMLTPVFNNRSENKSISSSFILSNTAKSTSFGTNSLTMQPAPVYSNTTIAPLASTKLPINETNPSNPFQIKSRTGTSALDDIQRALAPFSNNTSYQPGPESLYGTAKLESFREAGLNTISGPNTQPTSWMYQPSKKESFLSSSGGAPGVSNEDAASSSSRLQQVNASMDDLKDLAQNVERRINVIKTRLQSADEGSLDSILSSLKNLQPETGVRRSRDGAAAAAGDADPASSTFEDYYTSKKTKLSKALTELDRIYKNLELNSDDMTGLPEKPQPHHQYKLYRPTKSSDFVLAPQPKSEHLLPMQTRISSVFIPGLEKKKTEAESQSTIDKETESEFDVISKSFQAIVDEVNLTTNLLAKTNEENRRNSQSDQNVIETQKRTFNITLQSEEAEKSKPHMLSSGIETGPFNSIATVKKEPPATAPKPQDSNSVKAAAVSEMLQSQSSTYDNVRKEEAVQTNQKESGDASVQTTNEGKVEMKASSTHGSSDNNEAIASNSSVKSSLPSVTRQRVRPVRDNKIVQEDKKAKSIRREGGEAAEKVLGMPPSPGPSPKISRKIIYNNGADLENKIIKPPEMFQDEPQKPEAVSKPSIQQSTTSVKETQEKDTQPAATKQVIQKSKTPMQGSVVKRSDGQKKLEIKQLTMPSVSPSTARKIPPPTTSRPGTKTADTPAVKVKTAAKNSQEASLSRNLVGQQKSATTGDKKQLPASDADSESRSASSNIISGSTTASVAAIKLVTPAVFDHGAAASVKQTQSKQEKIGSQDGKNAITSLKKIETLDQRPAIEKTEEGCNVDTEILDEDDDVFLDAPTEIENVSSSKGKVSANAIPTTKAKDTKDKATTSIPKTKLKTPVKTSANNKDKGLQPVSGSPRVTAPASKSPLQLRRMGPQKPEVKKISTATTDSAKKTTVTLDKKQVPDESDSASARPQGSPNAPQTPTTPDTKPPLHPWKRPPSDSDKPSVSESTPVASISAAVPVSQSPAASPKTSSKIPRPVGADTQSIQQQGPVKAYNTSEDVVASSESSAQSCSVADDVQRRLRPSDRRLETETTSHATSQNQDHPVRPLSYHEVEDTVDGDSKRPIRDRKCLSAADAGNGEGVTDGAQAPVFRSEPALTDGPQQGDLRLSSPPSGQGAGGGARTRGKRIPADLMADSLATVPLTPRNK